MADYAIIPRRLLTDERFLGCSFVTQSVLGRIYHGCDNRGRVPADALALRARLAIFDPIDLPPHIAVLAKAGLVLVYRVAGRLFAELDGYESDLTADMRRKRGSASYPGPGDGELVDPDSLGSVPAPAGQTSGATVAPLGQTSGALGADQGQKAAQRADRGQTGGATRADQGRHKGATRAPNDGGATLENYTGAPQGQTEGRPGAPQGQTKGATAEQSRAEQSRAVRLREDELDLAPRERSSIGSPSASPEPSRVASGDGAHAPGGQGAPDVRVGDLPAPAPPSLPPIVVPYENPFPRGMGPRPTAGGGMDRFERQFGRLTDPEPTEAELLAKVRQRRREQGLDPETGRSLGEAS